MPTRIGRFPTFLVRFSVATFALGGLSACAVGDGVAHVVKLGVQAVQGSDQPPDQPNARHAQAPQADPQSPSQSAPPSGDDRPGDSAASPPPLPGAGPVAPVAEESLPPASSAKR